MKLGVALIVPVLVVLAGCGGEPASSTPAPSATVTETATATVTVTATPRAATPKRVSKPGPPRLPTTVPGDGTFHVGIDVAAGTYRNTGGREKGAPCVANTSRKPNDLQSFLRGSASAGPASITINKGEWFNTAYCKPFRRIGN